MNDRYLFRGKCAHTGYWLFGSLVCRSVDNEQGIDYLICNFDSGVESAVIPATIGQCTTLKDKNGVLIYEGDILRLSNHRGEFEMLAVKYSYKDAGFYAYTDYGSPRSICYSDCYAEIVGNVHDNPDIWKEGGVIE